MCWRTSTSAPHNSPLGIGCTLRIFIRQISPMDWPIVVIIILSFISLLLAIEWYRTAQRARTLQQKLQQLEHLKEELRAHLDETSKALHQYKARLAAQREAQDYYKNMANQLKLQLEHFTQNFLADQVTHLTKTGRREIQTTIEPFKESIEKFKARIDKFIEDTNMRHAELKEHIHLVIQNSQAMSDEAKRLTNALKADAKTQGIWGEMLLKRILESSGLQQGTEYELYPRLQDSNGKSYIPDVVVYLPQDRYIIIDAKVSLTAYERYANADDESQRERFLQEHVRSVEQHVETLHERRYHHLLEGSPELTLMFMPIEPALAVALRKDPLLYQKAFQKQIVIVTPSTLLATLRTIETIWRYDKQQKYALQIADEAGKLYDKFVGLIEDIHKLDRQLGTVHATLTDVKKKLNEGKGNLVDRIEKLKQLGARARKSLPKPRR